jgi:ubiquitin-conjugating enzyme E2 D/E
MAATAMVKRLQKELEIVTTKMGLDVELVDDRIDRWQIALPGPQGTPYEKGTFLVSLSFPPSFPLTAPEVTFGTRIYHPNIDAKGNVCMGLLKEWQLKFSIEHLLTSLLDLLRNPNAQDPLNKEAGGMYVSNISRYNETVRAYVTNFAIM